MRLVDEAPWPISTLLSPVKHLALSKPVSGAPGKEVRELTAHITKAGADLLLCEGHDGF